MTRLSTILLSALWAQVPSSGARSISKRALVLPATLPGSWQYVECRTDSVASRTLVGAAKVDAAMTSEMCIDFCDSFGYMYAGTEYTQECFCASSLSGSSVTASEAECNMACGGDATQPCGGPNRLNLFKNPNAGPGPSANPGPPGWGSLGCYSDGPDRTLAAKVDTAGGGGTLTVAKCTSACEAGNYRYAGVEYGGECFCGNSILNNGAPVSGCGVVCNGNSSEYCGGGWRLNMYEFGAVAVSSSTYSSSTTSSSTTSSSSTATATAVTCPGSDSSIWTSPNGAKIKVECFIDHYGGDLELQYTSSWEQCAAACSTKTGCKAFSWMPGTPGPCYMKSVVQAGQTNQGVWGGQVETSSTSSTSSLTSASSTSSLMSSSSSSAPPSATGWSYQGCWVDNAGGHGRVMQNQQQDSATLTHETCIQTCVGLGFKVAGMEYSQQCFCDNFIRNNATTSPDSDCNMACSGDATQKCGGPDRLTVFSTGPVEVMAVPKAQTTNLPGNWTYVGCLSDNVGGVRALPHQLDLKTNNSAEACLSECSKFGYPAGGMEYGDQCFCGDLEDVVAGGATLQPDSECNFPCPGNATYLCGAGNRISYYTWNGSSLYTWHYPTGNEAGEYQFFYGGVVIPLITSQTITKKVTFLEKHGTGAPNTTGAYEFDLALMNDFERAWRPMHVKTDVFCAAGLTLPDKAGRQINVGGWSLESTFGIRIYTPDGTPGVQGVNDWQEDVETLSLQDGRWYPTAMIMANGSILVVGGESGANAPAVPTLEILPAVGPPLFMEWLQRTDPFNLYPYLAVVPSGIFVLYYNEAIILDENTFETIKTLPLVPGAINHPDAGRTYPVEGSMMLLPQHAPYTEPLGVLACGGSSPQGEALDNCVSIQPEAADAEWVIERMPSKRVISCMTSLPDGTFLILNGAKQGVAGFALAKNPNLNAVLYDPSKPVHQRMSVMANTTIARMYHSEALLLADGRVLVSGSDPQDADYPQEYRVEVFVPPYLMGNPARPAFTVSSTDWAYGEAVTVTVTAGSTANLRVSLTGADSSTHGNTMGQRILFPEVSCAGSTCTVVAPPNAHICPPGWFQMWVLDGPTPSESTYVRIGGDPAGLGNWPNATAFQPLPGVGPAGLGGNSTNATAVQPLPGVNPAGLGGNSTI